MEVDFAFTFIIANTIAMEEFIVSFAVIIASTKEAVLAFTFKSITIVILVAIIVTIFIIKLALTSFINWIELIVEGSFVTDSSSSFFVIVVASTFTITIKEWDDFIVS